MRSLPKCPLIALLISGLSGCSLEIEQQALNSVASAIRNDSGLSSAQLKIYPNPAGEGFLIDLGSDDVSTRNLVWVYLGGKPYALNAASQKLSPSLPLAREAPEQVLRYATFRRETIETEVLQKLEGVRASTKR